MRTAPLLASLLALPLALSSGPVAAQEPPRQAQLLRLLRQDCGSCHGMRLTGGLGPALTAQALQRLPLEALAATIYHGRPGTPMPPWRAFLSEAEARWLAARLLEGLPEVEPMPFPNAERQP